MAERWQVAVDRDTCIGSGMCVGTAPKYFEFDDERSRPVTDEVESDDAVLAAAELCPMEAITVTEAGSGRVLAPEQ